MMPPSSVVSGEGSVSPELVDADHDGLAALDPAERAALDSTSRAFM
jgi:hypothetical protein